MERKKIISYLIIFNLVVILVTLLAKFKIIWSFINVIISIVIIPIAFAIFLFYILRPINNIFLKKKIKRGRAAFLTIVIFLFIFLGIARYFSNHLLQEFAILRDMIYKIIEEKQIMNIVKGRIDGNYLNFDYYSLFINQLQGRIGEIISNVRGIFSKSIQAFANIILVILVLFYLLRDGNKISENILRITPKKYYKAIDNILEEGDVILASYIMGQARVAMSLAIIIYLGYKVIGMTSAMFLATTTFILAFIPFIGFFISMIIPFIIAITLGTNMVIKLGILFIVAQTIKGRLVVPLIMGSAMNIHPVTDIFLVVGAAILFGPLGAFVVVPIYVLFKSIYKNFRPYLKEIKIKD